MPKRLRKKRQPQDVNQAAHAMVLRSTGQIESKSSELTQAEINRFMQEMGRKGGRKGGPARAAKLTDAQRSSSASTAARARWTKVRGKSTS